MKHILKSEQAILEGLKALHRQSYREALEKFKESLEFYRTFAGLRLALISSLGLGLMQGVWQYSSEALKELADIRDASIKQWGHSQILKIITRACEPLKAHSEATSVLQELQQSSLYTLPGIIEKLKDLTKSNPHLNSSLNPLHAQLSQINDLRVNHKIQEHEIWYVVSKAWLKRWEKYTQGQTMDEPGPVSNSDIIEKLPPSEYFLETDAAKQYFNVKLRKGCSEGLDYELFPQSPYKLLVNDYGTDGTEIKRVTMRYGSDDVRVEVQLREIHVTVLPDVTGHGAPTKKLLISNKDPVKLLKGRVGKSVREEVKGGIFNFEESKLWKLKQWASIKQLAQGKFNLKDLIQVDDDSLIEDSEIADEDQTILEFRRKDGRWTYNFAEPIDKCEKCKRPGQLMSCTQCKRVKYCSRDCQRKDWSDHKIMCNEYRISSSPIRDGLTGLQNLGNTCFMSSAIQCLSHTTPLTQYILQGRYRDEININNPLGTGGRLVSVYAELIRSLWTETNTYISPWNFKRMIGRIASQFSGYEQHDSQELLCYLVDGLHEDLNRVKDKPIVEFTESDGRPDEIVSAESWGKFLSRNQSIIVDLMYGQCKSTLVCPTCDRVSITFDPFLTYSVSIPNYEVRQQEVYHLKDSIQKFQIASTLGTTIGELKELISKETGQQVEVFAFSKTSISSSLGNSKELSDLQGVQFMAVEPPSTYDVIVPLLITKQPNRRNTLTRDPVTFTRPLFLQKTMTCRELYVYLIYYFKNFIERVCIDEISETAVEDLIMNSTPLFKLYSVNTTRLQYGYWAGSKITCPYCHQRDCYNCEVPVTDDKTLEWYLNLNENFKLELSWSNSLRNIEQINQMQSISRQLEVGNIRRSTTVTLQECIAHTSKPEKLDKDNTWYCSRCQDHVEATKTYQLYKLPRILIIHLKRFKSRLIWNEKLTNHVEFPVEGLDLKEYLIGDVQESTIYDLYAVTNHFGGANGGHYTAFVKTQNGWYEMDDTRVTRVNESRVITKSAYVLFYVRRE